MAQKVGSARCAWLVAGETVPGVSHLTAGRPNQDALETWPRRPFATAVPLALVAVADGHGGARHCRSHLGSKFAVEVTVATLRETVADLDAASDDERQRLAQLEIPERIVAAWNEKARAHIAGSPISDDEWRAIEYAEGPAAVDAVRADPLLAYGATLLAALATEQCIVITQLGDGDVLAVATDGTTTRPVPADERLNGNLTTSICRAGAEADFRSCVLSTREPQPALILLSTDGYANSFKSDADFLQVGRDFLDMLGRDGVAAVQKELKAILNHASQNGSGDDITLGLLQRADMMQATTAARRRKIEAGPEGVGKESEQRDAGAQVDPQLGDAEQHLGRLRRTAVVACLVALVAVGWSFRQQLGALRPAATGEPGKATSGPRKAPVDSSKSAVSRVPGTDTVKEQSASAAEPGKPTVVPEPRAPGSSAILPSIDHPAARRNEKGVTITATLVPRGLEPRTCSAEAIVWDGEARLGEANMERVEVPPSVLLKFSVPFVDAHHADHAKAKKKPGATFSIALTCDGAVVDSGDQHYPIGD